MSQSELEGNPELLDGLRKVAQNPLGRLPPAQEEQLIQLGLIRSWDDFIGVTERGRAVLEQADGQKPPGL